MDWTMDWIMDSILALWCSSSAIYRNAMNPGLPNEQGIGITVGAGICAAFSKTGWLVQATALLRDSTGRQSWDFVNTSQSLTLDSWWSSRSKPIATVQQ